MRLTAKFHKFNGDCDTVIIYHSSDDIKEVIKDYKLVYYNNEMFEWVVYKKDGDEYEASFAFTTQKPPFGTTINRINEYPTATKYQGCECGAASVGSTMHTRYCKLFRGW